jgi:hypothetical protein
MPKPVSDCNEPFPYKGAIRDADGRKPFNHYLWPTECWVFSQEVGGPHTDYVFRIEITSLADGRVATNGHVYGIEANRDCYGQPCVYATRAEAIRVSAARMIKLVRRAVRHRWGYTGQNRAPQIIEWARHVVARETGAEAKQIAPFRMPEQPKPKPNFDGLPLLQWGAADA